MRTSLLASLVFTTLIGCSGSDNGPPPTQTGDDDVTPEETCAIPSVVNSSAPATSSAWTLETLDAATYPTAVCNDGTSAVYAIRRNPASTHWLIWLEGGGACSNAEDCAARWQSSGPVLMSNQRAKDQYTAGTFTFPSSGVFANDPAVNPAFYNANLVKLQYCSSDGWSGDRAAVAGSGLDAMTHWNFRGRAIVTATIQTLLAHEALTAADDVVFAGGSAGGVGAYNNVDEVRALLPEAVRYTGMADAGFRIDYPAFDAATGVESTASPTTNQIVLAEADANWGGRGALACDTVATPETRAFCRSGAYLAQNGFIKTPLLIIQNQLDKEQLGKLGVDDPAHPTTAQSAYMNRFGAAMRDQLALVDARHAIFSDYSTAHTTAAQDDSQTATVDGIIEMAAISGFHASPCAPARNIDPAGAPIAPVAALRTCPTAGTGAIMGDVCFLLTPVETGLPASGENADADHYALRPTSGAVGSLMIFMVGSGGVPKNPIADPAVNFYTTARSAGMHVIALAYHNKATVASQCGDDDGCYEPTRLSILTGSYKQGGSEDVIDITADEGVYVRLASALATLAARDPAGGWGQFIDASRLDNPGAAIAWGHVIATGHSQGGGHAALLGKYLPLQRVVTLSSPCDAVNNAPASYLTADASWKTSPATLYAGLDVAVDPLCPTHAAAWTALGMATSRSHDDATSCEVTGHGASIRCSENAAVWTSMLTGE